MLILEHLALSSGTVFSHHLRVCGRIADACRHAGGSTCQEMSKHYNLTFLLISECASGTVKKIPQVPKASELDHSQVGRLIGDPSKMAEIAEFNSRYLHWDELRYRVPDGELDSAWVLMKAIRSGTAKHLNICGIDFNYSQIPCFEEYLHQLDLEYEGPRTIDGADERDSRSISDSSLMEESIASSQMEGAGTTREVAKKMLRTGRKPRDTGEMMIANNYAAMEFLKTKLDEDMSPELILEMHRVISRGTLSEGSEWEGRFREDDETVVGDADDADVVFHIPPAHGEVPRMIDELCDFINGDGDVFVHPVIKGIIIHFMIGYIHPFVNGNGRLARTLFYWFVMKKGYRIMEYTSVSRILRKSQTKYGLAYQYTETDGNDLTYFIKFNLECILKAIDELNGYVRRKELEKVEILDRISSDPNISYQESAILKDYSENKGGFTIREISKRYSLSYQTARNYVGHLCQLGYAKAAGKDRQTVLYVIDLGSGNKG